MPDCIGAGRAEFRLLLVRLEKPPYPSTAERCAIKGSGQAMSAEKRERKPTIQDPTSGVTPANSQEHRS